MGAVVERAVKFDKSCQSLRIKRMINDFIQFKTRPGPAKKRTLREKFRDQFFFAVWKYIYALKTPFEMIRTHVVISGNDHDAAPVAGYETVGEDIQKIQSFVILLAKFLVRFRRVRLDSMNYVAADDDEVGPSYTWGFFSAVVTSVVFKRIEENIVADRIVGIAMKVGYVQNAHLHR